MHPDVGVVTLEQGIEILRDSGATNGGFVFDCTHFTRGGTSLATLKSTPGRLIHCVQVCDGYLALPDGVTLSWNASNGCGRAKAISLSPQCSTRSTRRAD